MSGVAGRTAGVGIADGRTMAAGAVHELRPVRVPALLVGTVRSVSALLSGVLACVAVALVLSASPALAAGCANGVCAQGAAGTPVGAFSEFALPSGSRAGYITAGPDGNVWFTEANKIGRITPNGTISEFPLPETGNSPCGITAGPDGNVWFTDLHNKIGRITPTGTISEFQIYEESLTPCGITAGPDGNLWFTIGRVTPSGTITKFPIPSERESDPYGITAGPDGNLWFTQAGANKIGRITTKGSISEFPVPGFTKSIAAGPDGNLWFTVASSESIGRITPSGKISGFGLREFSEGVGITAGPDGNVWFTDTGQGTEGNIGRITPSGAINEFPTPTAKSNPAGITAGPDGNLWFTEGGKIGRVDPRLLPPPSATKCVVPQLKGKTGNQAAKLLRRANCKVGRVTRRATHKSRPVVISQKPAAKKTVPYGFPVSLRFG
jgi:streptogramin lyase